MRCGIPTEFQCFESGLGGDFATYLGGKTGTTYRVECMYGSIESAEQKMAELEGGSGNVIRVPASVRCKMCGGPLNVANISIDSETFIDAVLI